MSCLVIATLIVSRRLECVLFSNSYFNCLREVRVCLV